MPVFRRTDFLSSRTLQARAQSSSEAAALPNGEKALTPIIAGTISGTCIGVAWLVALIVILVKRYRRKKRYKKVGQIEDEVAKTQPRAEEFIVPPDPAVLQGSHQPGERVILAKKRRWWKAVGRRRASSVSADGRISKEKGKEKEVPPTRPRSASEHGRRPQEGQRAFIQDGVYVVPGERSDQHSQPPLHRLSTIVSALSQRSSPHPPFGHSTGDLPAGREDVKDNDFARTEHARTDNNNGGHNYPPS